MTATFENKIATTVATTNQKEDKLWTMNQVSGQVRASMDSNHARVKKGFPTESMLASQSKLHDIPKQCQGKLLCGGDDLLPARPDGQHVLKLVLEHGKGFFSRNGNTSISTSTNNNNGQEEAYAGGVSMLDFRRPINQGCFLLRDKNDIPLVLCLQDRHKLQSRAYYIHGREPLLNGQQQQQPQGTSGNKNMPKPVATQDGVNFYPWYRVVHSHYGATLEHRAKILMWNAIAEQYEPLLVAKHAKFESLNDYSDERKVSSNGDILFSTSGATPRSTKMAINDDDDQDYDFGFVSRDTSNRKSVKWNLTIAPGVDPALMICLTAIMEEFVGCVG